MDSIKIFTDIVNIITHEFAGAEELRHPAAHIPFLKYCADRAEHFGLEDRDLYLFMQLYLDIIGERELVFDIRDYAGFKHFKRGFSARSNGKDLYVSEVDQDTRLTPGEKIVQINQYSPAKFRQLSTFDPVDKPLSERDRWEPYLNYAKFVVVERSDGQTEKMILQEFSPLVQAPRLECREMAQGVTYLRVDSFADPVPLEELIEANDRELEKCKRLIVDLRWNSAGGMQEVMGMIVPYITDEITTDADFFRYSPTHTVLREKLRPVPRRDSPVTSGDRELLF